MSLFGFSPLHTLNFSFSSSVAVLSWKNSYHLCTCWSSVAKTDPFLSFEGDILGFEDVNLVMAAYTARRSFLYAAFSASVEISFFSLIVLALPLMLNSIRSCCFACELRASSIFSFKLQRWSMRDHVDCLIQDLLRFLAKSIVLSSTSLQMATLPLKLPFQLLGLVCFSDLKIIGIKVN